MHPDDLGNRAHYMQELTTLSVGNVREMEFRIWNGQEFRWFRSRDSIFQQDNGMVKQVIGIAEDITYEKKFEENTNPTQKPVGLN